VINSKNDKVNLMEDPYIHNRAKEANILVKKLEKESHHCIIIQHSYPPTVFWYEKPVNECTGSPFVVYKKDSKKSHPSEDNQLSK
jgi:hypothetical protein